MSCGLYPCLSLLGSSYLSFLLGFLSRIQQHPVSNLVRYGDSTTTVHVLACMHLYVFVVCVCVSAVTLFQLVHTSTCRGSRHARELATASLSSHLLYLLSSLLFSCLLRRLPAPLLSLFFVGSSCLILSCLGFVSSSLHSFLPFLFALSSLLLCMPVCLCPFILSPLWSSNAQNNSCAKPRATWNSLVCTLFQLVHTSTFICASTL